MRKYYQAGLVVIAIVSLVSLLFYRHEYNKLRYVLEVFNYFGKPNQKNVKTDCMNNNTVLPKAMLRFDEPLSSWQRLNDDLYVYSAYHIYDREIQVIGFGSPNSLKDMQCEIYFEQETKPILGRFTYLSIDSRISATNSNETVNYKGYHFYCAYTEYKIPVGITFVIKSDVIREGAPILPIKSQLHKLDYTNFGLCVIPPLTKPMQPLQMIGFMNFHNIIGVENFIVYDFGIPNELNSKFEQLSKAHNLYGKYTYANIPWNFPFPGISPIVIRDLIQADCLYRTYNKIMYIATLSWQEHIVLRYHHNLLDLMNDFKRSRMKADRYKLKQLTFCTDQSDSTATNITYTIFKKLSFDSSIPEHEPTYIVNTHEILTQKNIYAKDIGSDLATLNYYKSCPEKWNSGTNVEDKTILRFAEDVQNSQMFKKFVIENKLLRTSGE